jgi:hypothetical protein
MKKLYLFLFLICFLSLASATTDYLPHKLNTTLDISFSDTIASACNISTMNMPNGTSITIDQEMGVSANTFSATINAGNFSILGVHCFNIECDDGYGDVCRDVTNNGELANGSKIALSVVFIIILLIFFGISLVGLFKTEDYKGKFTLYWVCHLLSIGITFIIWQTAGNYLSMDGGIAGMFKIFFYFFSYSAFPMILLSLAWIFYIHTFNEHFEKLIDKGEDPETAFKLTKRKRKGWLAGK